MRQVAAAVALALSLSTAWLAATTIPASADDQIPLEQAWGGSRVDPVDPVTTPTSELRIRGRIQNGAGRQDSVAYARPTVTVTVGADEQTRCASGPDYPAVGASPRRATPPIAARSGTASCTTAARVASSRGSTVYQIA